MGSSTGRREVLSPHGKTSDWEKGSRSRTCLEKLLHQLAILQIARSKWGMHTLERLGQKRGVGRRFNGEKARWWRRDNAAYLFRNIGGEVEGGSA